MRAERLDAPTCFALCCSKVQTNEPRMRLSPFLFQLLTVPEGLVWLAFQLSKPAGAHLSSFSFSFELTHGLTSPLLCAQDSLYTEVCTSDALLASYHTSTVVLEHRAFRHVSSKGKGRGGSKQGKAKASLMGACGSQSKLQNPSPKS